MNSDHPVKALEKKNELDPQQLLRIIFDYASKITNERRLDYLLLLMADMGREMILADRCTVWLLDKQKNELYSKVAHGVPPLRMPASAGLVGHSIAAGSPIFINDAYENVEYKEVLLSGAIAMDKQTGYRTKSLMVIPFHNNEGEIMGAFQAVNKLTADEAFSEKDVEYLSLAASYAGKSLESALLSHEIEETQKEIIYMMGEIGESRSKETGNHVKRVAEYSYIIALGLGMSQEEAELLKIASPMHDIGKVAIPDELLKKPGKLTVEEFNVMKTHAEIGYGLLKNSSRRILRTAAIVAHQHHEKWNGTGYPLGLKGEEIHIYGRITAIADVFDALGTQRVYKEAWELDRILTLFHEERGQHFDPRVVDTFMEHLPRLLEVREAYSDSMPVT
ncbi:HD domain-containing phosphohydrolase [Paenibacillus sp. UNC451MF]|uniref:HD domain-containing phosphohydrolase n=1 Tax=Paenibacillus sp. UNC451MF TaxID=1449063 RepID=UPI000AC2C9C6|nr:HD domain-containing phosphohydrolase [Paenibacillus sp. UNC451MF]